MLKNGKTTLGNKMLKLRRMRRFESTKVDIT